MKFPKVLPSILGFFCGICATGPMTAWMIALHRQLPKSERYPLPPREIAESLLRKTHSEEVLTAPARTALVWLAHFGYGGAAGAIYANLPGPIPPAARGPIFGLIIWLTSYLGLLPALGILASAEKHPARRNALMISAHLIWGFSVGMLLPIFSPRSCGPGK